MIRGKVGEGVCVRGSEPFVIGGFVIQYMFLFHRRKKKKRKEKQKEKKKRMKRR
jgi:hypothetical protein